VLDIGFKLKHIFNCEVYSLNKVSTDLPTLIDSKIQLPEESIKDFLDYFGARKYKMNKGYSVE